MASSYWDTYWRRRLSRRRFVTGSAAVGVGAVGFTLVGCGDDDDDDDDGTPRPATATATPAPGATPTPQEAGRRGGTMRTTKASPDTGLDPHITVTNPLHPAKAYSHPLVYQLSTNEYFLDLPVAFEQAEPTKMVFTLREGLKFNPDVSNGRDLTSEDVAYSLARFPDTLANFGSEVNRIQWGWMESFDTPDPQTVVINLAAPYASAIPSMGSSAFAIVARELVEANGGRLSDVMNAGSGPYMMTRRDNTGTRYERNPNYYEHDPAYGTFVKEGPYIDTWEELIISDASASEARFLAGDVDVLNTALVAVDKLKADELRGQPGVVVARATNHGNLPITLDFEKWAPHPRLREAFSLAIDRQKYIDVLLLGEGLLGSQVGPIFDSVLSQDELAQYQKFDPARARRLWEEAGGNDVFPNGLRTVSQGFSQFSQTMNDFIKRELEANLGISVTVTPADLATYVAVATARNKDWEYFISSEQSITTIPDYNALTFSVPIGYGSIFGNLRLDSPVPETKAFAEKAQEMFMRQSQELDHEKRKQILREMQIFYHENFGNTIPLPVAKYVYGAYRERVKNFPEADFGLGNSSAGVFRVHNLYLQA